MIFSLNFRRHITLLWAIDYAVPAQQSTIFLFYLLQCYQVYALGCYPNDMITVVREPEVTRP